MNSPNTLPLRAGLSHNTPPQRPHLCAKALDKAYPKGDQPVRVLRGVDVEVHRGEFLSVVGQSGSGKSTLMHLLGLLDEPDVGEIWLEGNRVDKLPERTRDELRNNVFGFVFQSYYLLPELNLLENVLSPLMIRYSTFEFLRRRRELQERGLEIIEKVGLSHRLRHRPSELSGGEMQRAAIARALAAKPSVLLADEPTGNLDARTGMEIMKLLHHLNEAEKLTIVMVTHDEKIAVQADRIVRLGEGRIQQLNEVA